MFHWPLCVPVRRGRNSQYHESVWKYTELPAPNRAAYIFHDNLSPRPAGPRPGGAPQWTPSRSAAAAAGARATVFVGLIGIRPGAGFSESIRLGKAAERVCRRARRNDGGEVGGRQRNIADEADRELGGWCRPERQESGQRGEGGGGGGIALGTVEGSRGLGRRAAAGLASGSPPSVQRPGEPDGGWVGSCPGHSLRGSRGVCVGKAAGLQDSVRSGGRGKTAATGFGVG